MSYACDSSSDRVTSIGCIRYLNTKPLIHGLENDPQIQPVNDVPSGCLKALETGRVAMALCPVIDLQTSRCPLMAVPVGGIACHGTTLTVRLFSRIDWCKVEAVFADTDSHTSVMLMRLLMHEVYGRKVQVNPFSLRQGGQGGQGGGGLPETMLLIGDKVVTAGPSPSDYPYQLDLGEAWLAHTQLPFVFAIWQAVAGTDLRDVPQTLDRLRVANLPHRRQIAEQYGPALGWPAALAGEYLTRWMQYELTDRHFQAIEFFFRQLHRLGWIAQPKPIRLAKV